MLPSIGTRLLFCVLILISASAFGGEPSIRATSEIRGFNVLSSDNPKRLVVEIHYRYEGEFGRNVRVGAVPTSDGKRLFKEFGPRSQRVAGKGYYEATVELNTDMDLATNGLSLYMWIDGEDEDYIFCEVVKPYRRLWGSMMPAPRPQGPDDWQKFSPRPQTIFLTWTQVSGANGYRVEVDCFECVAAGRWDSKAGKSDIKSLPNVVGYPLANFAGKRWGRWRVWAVNNSGKEGAKSDWQHFSFD